MNKFLFSLLLIICFKSNAQTISGIVKSSTESIAEAQIVTNTNVTTTTNAEGAFNITLPNGVYKLKISAIGYNTKVVDVTIANNENKTLEIILEPRAKELKIVTISGSRFAKRAAEEVVSIEVIKPNFIKNASINTVDEALNKLPGVDVIDNQINIRGGSGWSYGAGSRVMVLLNDIPMLTANASDAKWDFMPLENCEQIEVIKGAAG